MRITLFGTESQVYQRALQTLHRILSGAEVPYHINTVSNVSTFLEKEINSIPAIQVNNEAIISLNRKNIRQNIEQIISTHITCNMTKEIIIPVDYSDYSVFSVKYGQQLAEQLDAQVKALHVYRPKLSPQTLDIDTLAESKEMLNILVDKINDNADKAYQVEGVHREGFAGEVIMDEAKNAEIILMSNTGAGNNIKRFLGSVSSEVIQQVDCPVFLVPKNAKFEQIKSLLYAYDEMPNEDSISKISDLAQCCNATIEMVHVASADEEVSNDALVALLENNGHDISFKLTTIHSPDSIAKTLTSHAQNSGHQLLVLDKRKHNFFDRLFGSSVLVDLKEMIDIPIVII